MTVHWLGEESGEVGRVGDGSVGYTYMQEPSGQDETTLGRWLFNVVDNGKVIFTETRGGPAEGWWPLHGAMIHAKALWNQFKKLVCFERVARPKSSIEWTQIITDWPYKAADRETFPCGYDGVGWISYSGDGGCPCPKIPTVQVPTSSPVQEITCAESCQSLYGPTGAYPNAAQLAQCLKGCKAPLTVLPLPQRLRTDVGPQVTVGPILPSSQTVVASQFRPVPQLGPLRGVDEHTQAVRWLGEPPEDCWKVQQFRDCYEAGLAFALEKCKVESDENKGPCVEYNADKLAYENCRNLCPQLAMPIVPKTFPTGAGGQAPKAIPARESATAVKPEEKKVPAWAWVVGGVVLVGGIAYAVAR